MCKPVFQIAYVKAIIIIFIPNYTKLFDLLELQIIYFKNLPDIFVTVYPTVTIML
jgi:hypothetical protein